MRRVAIAAGGTAGHVYPALAIADAYCQADRTKEVLFFGTAVGFEARLIRDSGYPFQLVHGSPLVGETLHGKGRALRELVLAFVQTRPMLKSAGVSLVIGLGGYASAGTLLAARSQGVRTAIHESNAVAGLANRLLGKLVDRVYLGFETARREFPQARTVVTGNPVRSDVATLRNEPHPPPVKGRPVRILVAGGSQGSPFINQRAPMLLSRLNAQGLPVEVWHQTGKGNRRAVCTAYQKLGLEARTASYIQDMAEAYRWADFAVACAGAATIAELATVGLPVLFVPLCSAARGHQVSNAIVSAEVGGAWWVAEDQWREEALAAKIAALLSDEDAWTKASRRIRRLAQPEAGRTLVSDCEALLAAN